MNHSEGTRDSTTVRSVAVVAGVSTATAARALGGYGTVSDKTRQKVQEAADQIGYRPNRLARSMITGKTKTLGLVIADIENSFFASASRGFADAARSAGYDVLIANTDEEPGMEQSAVRSLIERRVDGIVVSPASARITNHLERAVSDGIPLVLLDRHLKGFPADSVLVNSKEASRTAMTHLIEHGHSRIGILTGTSPAHPAGEGARPLDLISSGQERLQGYRAALKAAGLPVRPEYVKCGDFHREASADLTHELLALTEPPTALLATDSVITLGALTALHDAGLRIPTDISLIGIDDAEWATVVNPPLTVVAQPAYELGELAAQRVLERVQGGSSRPRRRNLPTRLIIRKSVAAPSRKR